MFSNQKCANEFIAIYIGHLEKEKEKDPGLRETCKSPSLP
jgi:hypothetical protein